MGDAPLKIILTLENDPHLFINLLKIIDAVNAASSIKIEPSDIDVDLSGKESPEPLFSAGSIPKP